MNRFRGLQAFAGHRKLALFMAGELRKSGKLAGEWRISCKILAADGKHLKKQQENGELIKNMTGEWSQVPLELPSL